MNNKVNIYELEKTLNTILKIIDKNLMHKLPKKITNDERFALMKDLKQLFETYNQENLEKSVKLIKSRYIPLLNLLIKIEYNQEYKIEYLNMLENAYLLGARRDFGCFLVYYEWESNDKIYESRYSILKAYVHYLNEMTFNPNFTLLIANLPSGYGKTRIAKLYEAFRFGIDPTGTFLSLCSNDTVVKGGSRSVIDIIKDERFGNVFPNLSYQNLGKDLFLKETDGEWKLKQCGMLASYYASTVNSNVVGQRASLSIHIDDLYADYKEALDENLNMYYFNKYQTVWTERFVKGKKPQIIITGTMWSPTDFITKVIELTKTETEFYVHPKFKYTLIDKDQTKVIVQVPALDPETGLSSCEDLVSTKDLLRKKASIEPYLWETNYQQNPTTPEGLQFEYKKLKLYDSKPENIHDLAYAVIDGTRKSGKDFFSMPIYIKYYEDYALYDCIFTKTATSDLIDEIIDKIIEHHIVKLVIESNVDGGLKRTLEEKLHSKGVYYCEIIEKYNTEVKATRIEKEKGNIVKKIWFPSRKCQEPNTDIYRFMQNFTLYNASGRNKNDDAPDSNALFTAIFVTNVNKIQKVKPIIRKF